jgi:hypothetical protein
LLSRWIAVGLVLLLLAATAVAFGRIEGLKLETNPIAGPAVDATFSPVCRCDQRVAHISFRLKKAGSLTVAVLAPDNRVVNVLVPGRHLRRGPVRVTWNGRSDAGVPVPDGTYRIRIHLGGQHRNIVLPKGMRVDTVAPRARLLSAAPRIISPDHDHRADVLTLRYRVSKPAHVRVLVNGRVRVRGRFAPLSGTLRWPGTARGKVLRAGRYRVSLVAQDLAGNLSRPTRPVVVSIRFVALARQVIRARVGTRFGVRVFSDARPVHWRFLGARGTTAPGLLVLRARKAGRHVLTVEANGHSARAVVVISRRQRHQR